MYCDIGFALIMYSFAPPLRLRYAWCVLKVLLLMRRCRGPPYCCFVHRQRRRCGKFMLCKSSDVTVKIVSVRVVVVLFLCMRLLLCCMQRKCQVVSLFICCWGHQCYCGALLRGRVTSASTWSARMMPSWLCACFVAVVVCVQVRVVMHRENARCHCHRKCVLRCAGGVCALRCQCRFCYQF